MIRISTTTTSRPIHLSQPKLYLLITPLVRTLCQENANFADFAMRSLWSAGFQSLSQSSSSLEAAEIGMSTTGAAVGATTETLLIDGAGV